MSEERAKRMQERFDALKRAVEMTHGKDIAFAAGACAWLMAIERSVCDSMEILGDNSDQYAPNRHHRLDEFKQEVRQELQGFHQALCVHLGVPHEAALKTSHHFDQFLRDMFGGKG